MLALYSIHRWEILFNNRATAVALGRKPMISTRPFPLTRTARLITGHPLPPNPLTDTREVSCSPIIGRLELPSSPRITTSLNLWWESRRRKRAFHPYEWKMREPTYPFRDSCYLYVLIHLLQETHYSKRRSRIWLIACSLRISGNLYLAC